MTIVAVISPKRALRNELQQTLRRENFFVLDVQTIDEIVRFAATQPIHFIVYDDASPISIAEVQQRLNQVNSIDIPIIVLANTHSDLVDLYRLGALNVLDSSVATETLKLILMTYLKHMDIRLRYKVQSITLNNANKHLPINVEIPDSKVAQIPSIIRKHIFTTPISIEFLANELSISRRHLLRKIYDKYDKTAINLINEVKMSICHELLLEGKHTIDEISELLGFKSQYYFKKKYEIYLKGLSKVPINKKVGFIHNP
jgi:AraC-like DNA-binding protein